MELDEIGMIERYVQEMTEVSDILSTRTKISQIYLYINKIKRIVHDYKSNILQTFIYFKQING